MFEKHMFQVNPMLNVDFVEKVVDALSMVVVGKHFTFLPIVV